MSKELTEMEREVIEWARAYRNLYRAMRYGPVPYKIIEANRRFLFDAVDAYEAEIADAPE